MLIISKQNVVLATVKRACHGTAITRAERSAALAPRPLSAQTRLTTVSLFYFLSIIFPL